MTQQTTYHVTITEPSPPDKETAAANLRDVILDGLGFPENVAVQVELIAGRPVDDVDPDQGHDPDADCLKLPR